MKKIKLNFYTFIYFLIFVLNFKDLQKEVPYEIDPNFKKFYYENKELKQEMNVNPAKQINNISIYN